MPELVASLHATGAGAVALMPGMGEFLFRPMALAVAFAMISAYLLSRSFVPSRCASWLKAHHGHEPHVHGQDFEHREPEDEATTWEPRVGSARPSHGGRR